MNNTGELEVFEVACKYYSEKMSEFKTILETKVSNLTNVNWTFQKGTTKVCAEDETGRKKRCKVGMSFGSKVSLTSEEVSVIWNEFKSFYEKTNVSTLEYNDRNQEIGRYEFIASNSYGDIITCTIYLENEWNIPQISMLCCVSARYKKESKSSRER